MRMFIRLGLAIVVVSTIVSLHACGPSGGEDTTNGEATPAPCTSDADCPEGVACTFFNGEDESGFCDVEETSSPTPAPCTSDEDCGDEVAYIFPNGPDESGICDVDETVDETQEP